MGYRYTVVDFNSKEDVYELSCYHNDECVYFDQFVSTDEAHKVGDRFLSGENVASESAVAA